jgi:hypothetical protein
MLRLAIALILLLPLRLSAQVTSVSDPLAISLAQQSVSAITTGAPVSDVTVTGNVVSIIGDDSQTGIGTFQAKGTSESRVDLTLANGTRSDVRSVISGIPSGAWVQSGGTPTSYAFHNCWTDAAWFFPALSSLSQTANAGFVFKYIGLEPHGTVNTQHIQVYQWSAQASPSLAQLSSMDFYLDAISSLPVAIAFNVHPDDNMDQNIPVEIDFANYQAISGVQVPIHFQEIYNGGVTLDVTVTNTAINTGLPDTLFTLQLSPAEARL